MKVKNSEIINIYKYILTFMIYLKSYFLRVLLCFFALLNMVINNALKEELNDISTIAKNATIAKDDKNKKQLT
jgi:hypothetical protein